MEEEPFLTYPWTLLRNLWQAILFVDAILIFVPGPQLFGIFCVLAVVILLVIVFIPYDGLDMASPYVNNLLLSPCNLILGATILIQHWH